MPPPETRIQTPPVPVVIPIETVPRSSNTVLRITQGQGLGNNMPTRFYFLTIVEDNLNQTYQTFNYLKSDGSVRKTPYDFHNMGYVKETILGPNIGQVSAQSKVLIEALNSDISLYSDKNVKHKMSMPSQIKDTKNVLSVYNQYLSFEGDAYEYRHQRRALLSNINSIRENFMMDNIDTKNMNHHQIYNLFKGTKSELRHWDPDLADQLTKNGRAYYQSYKQMRQNPSFQKLSSAGLVDFVFEKMDYDPLTHTDQRNRDLYFRNVQQAKQGALKTFLKHKANYNPLGWSDQKISYYDDLYMQQYNDIIADPEIYLSNAIEKAKLLKENRAQTGYQAQKIKITTFNQKAAAQSAFDRVQHKINQIAAQPQWEIHTLPDGTKLKVRVTDPNKFTLTSTKMLHLKRDMSKMKTQLQLSYKRQAQTLSEYNKVAWQKIHALEKKGVDVSHLKHIMLSGDADGSYSYDVGLSQGSNNRSYGSNKGLSSNRNYGSNKSYSNAQFQGQNTKVVVPAYQPYQVRPPRIYAPGFMELYSFGTSKALDFTLGYVAPDMDYRLRENISLGANIPIAAGGHYLYYRIFMQPTYKLTYRAAIGHGINMAYHGTKANLGRVATWTAVKSTVIREGTKRALITTGVKAVIAKETIKRGVTAFGTKALAVKGGAASSVAAPLAIFAFVGIVMYPALKGIYKQKQFEKKHNIKRNRTLESMTAAIRMKSCDMGFRRFDYSGIGDTSRPSIFDNMSEKERQKYFDDLLFSLKK